MLPRTPKSPRVSKCSIGKVVGTDCGLSARFPVMKEMIPIPSCSRDVTMHLKSVKVSSSSVVSEGELILLRAGIFDDDGKGMTVCPKHRECLGVYWRPSRLCKYPFHRDGASRTKAKCDRGVSKKLSIEVKRKWNSLLPIGSGEISCALNYSLRSAADTILNGI